MPSTWTTTCMLRFMAIRSPETPRTVEPMANLIVPSLVASKKDCSATWAVPPMWKVRMVNWVPGSPMDWAAMTPTASPMFTRVPRARSRP